MHEKKKLRVGVIGSGEFARTCHIPGLQSHPEAEVVALCSSDPKRGREVADHFGIGDVYTDYRDLCARTDVDAVSIATPNVFHASQTICALQHGKHVLCEKPLAMNVAEAQSMLTVALESGRIHHVAFTFRYGYAMRELRRRVNTGDIGQPYYVRIQYDGWTGLKDDWKVGWREDPSRAGGGLLFDLGAHLFDAARFVLGPIRSVIGFVEKFPRVRQHMYTNEPMLVETDDIASASFRHSSGTRGHWFISRVTPTFAENGYLEVVGTEGALKAALSRGKLDVLKVSRPTDPDWKELPLSEEARDGRPHSLGIMMRSFVDACLGNTSGESIDATFHDGLAVQQAIDAVTQSQESGTCVEVETAGSEMASVRSL